MTTLKLYTAEGCGPCDEIHEALDQENYQVLGVPGEEPPIETIDVGTDEGYAAYEAAGVVDVLPLARYEMRQCHITRDEASGLITFDCRSDDERETDRPVPEP